MAYKVLQLKEFEKEKDRVFYMYGDKTDRHKLVETKDNTVVSTHIETSCRFSFTTWEMLHLARWEDNNEKCGTKIE